MNEQLRHPQRATRRELVRSAVLAGASLAAVSPGISRSVAATTSMSVLCAAPPDPAPPGVADFATGAFAAWRSRHDAFVSYDPVAWPQLFRRLETYFDAESRVYDLMYLAHWIPEFHDSLDPISGELPGGVVADMPDSSWNACRWSGETLGCPTTLSLLTLFVNAGHLAESGVPAAPATWEQLKEAASDL